MRNKQKKLQSSMSSSSAFYSEEGKEIGTHKKLSSYSSFSSLNEETPSLTPKDFAVQKNFQ